MEKLKSSVGGISDHGRRRFSIVFIVVALAALLFFTTMQTRRFSPSLRIENIEKNGLFMPLNTWEVLLYDCQKVCLPHDMEPISIDFPAFAVLGQIKDRSQLKSNAIKLTHRVSIQAINAFKESGKQVANFVIPRSIQGSLEGEIAGIRHQITAGNQQNIVWTVSVADLERSPYISLFLYLNYAWQKAGPADFPMALVDVENSHGYAKISDLQGLTQYLGNDWYVLFAFAVALLTLIIDFSLPIFVLASYFLAFSLRTIIYTFPNVEALPLGAAIMIANVAVVALLIGFVLSLFGKLYHYRKIIYSLALIYLLVQVVLYGRGLFFDISDLLTDTVGAAIGLIGIIVGVYQWKAETKRRDETIGLVRYFSYALIALAFLLQLQSNGADLQSVLSASQKNAIQIGHYLHLPLLLLGSILEIGSMRSMLSKLEVFAVQQREITDGRTFQAANLPKNSSYQSDLFSWKTYHIPFNPLSGDWFDIEQFSIADATVAIGCIVDVTGHGIIAAQHISTVISAWHQCKSDFKDGYNIYSRDEIENFLYSSASEINEALMAIPAGRGASSIIFVFNIAKRDFYFLSNGHPGILVAEMDLVDYIHLSNDRHGNGHFFDLKAHHVELPKACEVLVFSDGFFDASVSDLSNHDDLKNLVNERISDLALQNRQKFADDATLIHFNLRA